MRTKLITNQLEVITLVLTYLLVIDFKRVPGTICKIAYTPIIQNNSILTHWFSVAIGQFLNEKLLIYTINSFLFVMPKRNI